MPTLAFPQFPMVRLTNAALLRAHRFLLDVHSAGNRATLRRLVPDGLSRLIGCDRASFNEMEIAEGRKEILPTPVPAWWPRLGQVYRDHLMDHPLWNPCYAPRLNRVVDIAEPRYRAPFRKSALFQEYFVPLGVHYQISTLVSCASAAYVGIAVNRSAKPFIAEDRSVLRLVSLHIMQAWRNVAAIERANLHDSFASTEPAPAAGSAMPERMIAVDPERGIVRGLSRGAAELFKAAFGRELEEDCRLPEDMRRWLQAQRSRLMDPAALNGMPPGSLLIRAAKHDLHVRLVQVAAHETVLALERRGGAARNRPSELPAMTPRESEILKWLGEGKRNQEIATILNISVRTVGKHIEHILEKLGVETRTAAARIAFEATLA